MKALGFIRSDLLNVIILHDGELDDFCESGLTACFILADSSCISVALDHDPMFDIDLESWVKIGGSGKAYGFRSSALFKCKMPDFHSGGGLVRKVMSA